MKDIGAKDKTLYLNIGKVKQVVNPNNQALKHRYYLSLGGF